ncbi:zinc metalloprotease [Neptunitalea chrysea]|uniref:Zinc metalloprotease n=1 Tax=Neptunitalea chrysea TaxID=1647581 RepID=A0A9W6EU89_9FLAO|nr:RIP metalloprotease RseP [Neptunitalea chrysea]GLB51396.1 zinc metalloprotease [Neptunitalea chrysea]
MSPFLVKALQLFLSLSILIVLHELGHFIPAKIFKTRVEKFFLFFDVKFALFKKKIGETVYGIGWLPLGGYVKIAGMIDESMDKEQMKEPAKPWEFRSKPAWQRLIIMVGGVTVNLIVGFLIYTLVFYYNGSKVVKMEDLKDGFEVNDAMKAYGFKDGDKILSYNDNELDDALKMNWYLLVRDVSEIEVVHKDGVTETIALPDSLGMHLFKEGAINAFVPIIDSISRDAVIRSVEERSPASKAGFLAGDKVMSINDTPVAKFSEISSLLKEGENVIVVHRDVKDETISVTPVEGKIGIGNRKLISTKYYTFGEAVKKGTAEAYWTLHDYASQLKYLFTSKGASQMGGFGSIGSIFSPTWDWVSFWEKTAFISIVLAFMNILPIPALDGGHVLFLMYEMITGRKPSDKFLEYAQLVGFIIVISLVLYANGNDLYRYVIQKFFGG